MAQYLYCNKCGKKTVCGYSIEPPLCTDSQSHSLVPVPQGFLQRVFGNSQLRIFGIEIFSFQFSSNLRDQDETPTYEKLLQSSLIIKFEDCTGNAVAISSRLAITAIHKIALTGSQVILIDKHGVRFNGKVLKSYFKKSFVDICLLGLERSEQDFKSYTEVCIQPISIGQDLLAVGLEPDEFDNLSKAVYKCSVQKIHEAVGSAMFQSSYYSFDGFSGAAILTRKMWDGSYKVVGVHVGKHDESTGTAKVGKSKSMTTKTLAGEINLALGSIDSNIHGHNAYCLVCEVARVPELVTELRNRIGGNKMN